MELYEEPDPNWKNQLSFESPSFLAAAEKDISHGIDALNLEGNSQMRLPAAGDADFDAGEGVRYPIRPSETDCAFYIRTGCCKFGSYCRFNHPREKRVVQGRNTISSKEFRIIKERDKGFSKVFDQCKFYLMPGGCRFGEDCRYSHNHEITQSVLPVELNNLGLPIRKGERVCSYYMRTGTCKYYSSCKFHHPELSDVTGPPPTSQTLPAASEDAGSNFNSLQPYTPAAYSEWLNLYRDQIRCQDSSLPSLSRRTDRHPSDVVDQTGYSKMVDFPPMQQKEAIDNPKEAGESQSQNGIRYEGFRLTFPWFPNHSKDHLSESEGCLLSPIGLPQRPDHPVCIYYSRFGICKYGPACKFDHPVDENTQQSITRSSEEKMEGEASLPV